MICYRILSELLDKSYNDYLSISDEINTYLSNKDLIALINKRKEQYKSEDSYHISRFYPDTKEENKIIGGIIKDLAEKHKDKVMYLDIWATWCGPCKTEIPFSIELQEYYAKEQIVFVNFCLSSDKDEWERTIKNSHIRGENYYFNKAQSELLRSKLNFSGYPTYMIIDKSGNVVDDNAPRPSSDEIIKKKINRLIAER